MNIYFLAASFLALILASSSYQSPHTVLDVLPGASSAEINRAYRRLAARYHPDRVPQEEKAEAEEKFKTIAQAYDQLKEGRNEVLDEESQAFSSLIEGLSSSQALKKTPMIIPGCKSIVPHKKGIEELLQSHKLTPILLKRITTTFIFRHQNMFLDILMRRGDFQLDVMFLFKCIEFKNVEAFKMLFPTGPVEEEDLVDLLEQAASFRTWEICNYLLDVTAVVPTSRSVTVAVFSEMVDIAAKMLSHNPVVENSAQLFRIVLSTGNIDLLKVLAMHFEIVFDNRLFYDLISMTSVPALTSQDFISMIDFMLENAPASFWERDHDLNLLLVGVAKNRDIETFKYVFNKPAIRANLDVNELMASLSVASKFDHIEYLLSKVDDQLDVFTHMLSSMVAGADAESLRKLVRLIQSYTSLSASDRMKVYEKIIQSVLSNDDAEAKGKVLSLLEYEPMSVNEMIYQAESANLRNIEDFLKAYELYLFQEHGGIAEFAEKYQKD